MKRKPSKLFLVTLQDIRAAYRENNTRMVDYLLTSKRSSRTNIVAPVL